MVTLTMLQHTAGSAPLLAQRLKAAGRAVWRELEILGHLRAAGELERLAAGYALAQPELAERMREAARAARKGAAR